jgi:hypothetical protein
MLLTKTMTPFLDIPRLWLLFKTMAALPDYSGSPRLSQAMAALPDNGGSPRHTNPVDYLVKVSELLTASLGSEPHKADWSYPSIVGKLHYLEACTRPDLAHSVHQADRFSANPRKPHADAVTQIC